MPSEPTLIEDIEFSVIPFIGRNRDGTWPALAQRMKAAAARLRSEMERAAKYPENEAAFTVGVILRRINGGGPAPREEAPTPTSWRMCTCTGSCKGPEGLAAGWRCAMLTDDDGHPRTPAPTPPAEITFTKDSARHVAAPTPPEMAPGQRCTRIAGHHLFPDHGHDPTNEARWDRNLNAGERCPYIEPPKGTAPLKVGDVGVCDKCGAEGPLAALGGPPVHFCFCAKCWAPPKGTACKTCGGSRTVVDGSWQGIYGVDTRPCPDCASKEGT